MNWQDAVLEMEKGNKITHEDLGPNEYLETCDGVTYLNGKETVPAELFKTLKQNGWRRFTFDVPSVVYIVRLPSHTIRNRYLQYLKDRYKERYLEVRRFEDINQRVSEGKAIVFLDNDLESMSSKWILIDKNNVSIIKWIKSPTSKILWRRKTKNT